MNSTFNQFRLPYYLLLGIHSELTQNKVVSNILTCFVVPIYIDYTERSIKEAIATFFTTQN